MLMLKYETPELLLDPAPLDTIGPFYGLKLRESDGYIGESNVFYGDVVINDLSKEDAAREYYELGMHLDPFKTEICDIPRYQFNKIDITATDLNVNPKYPWIFHLKDHYRPKV
jgi:hypothetical protein